MKNEYSAPILESLSLRATADPSVNGGATFGAGSNGANASVNITVNGVGLGS